MFKDVDGDLVNVRRAIHVGIHGSDDECKVSAYFGDPTGASYPDGSWELGGYDYILFKGTRQECEGYMEWLYRELDVDEYLPVNSRTG